MRDGIVMANHGAVWRAVDPESCCIRLLLPGREI